MWSNQYGKVWDIGVDSVAPKNWTEITTVNVENCNSFATSTYRNNALIYGCSRLQPFRYNGICYENCSWHVFYDNGIERCIDKECNFTLNLPLVHPRNWSICIEC